MRASLLAQLIKNPPAMRETWVQSLGWEVSPEEGKGYRLQYSGLENSMNCIVHVVTKSRTRLSDFYFQFSHQNDTDLIGPEKAYIAQTTGELPV